MKIAILIISLNLILLMFYARYKMSVLHSTMEEGMKAAISDFVGSLKKVAGGIRWLVELFSSNDVGNKWFADDVLIHNVLDSISSESLLPQNATKYEYGYFGKYPQIMVQIMPKTQMSLDILHPILENVVIQRLAYCNVKPFVYVYSEPCSAQLYWMYVCYAVEEAEKQALQEMITKRALLCSNMAQKNNEPIQDKELLNGVTKNGRKEWLLGYDLLHKGIEIVADIFSNGHLCVVGESGAGKSVFVQWILYNLLKAYDGVSVYVADFKKSGDYVGFGAKSAEFDGVTELIDEFYELFQNTPENCQQIKILLIDEYAGYMTWLAQTDKKKAEEIKGKIANLLMLGRSRHCYVWCVQQRITATLFPSGIGAIDNFQVCVGLGRLSPDSRKSLFAGEVLEDDSYESAHTFTQGQGIILVNGQPLRAFEVPEIKDKARLDEN